MYQNIRNLREDTDTSQEVLAKLLNISQATYSRYETGVLDIPSRSLIQLAEYYSTSIDYLVGLTTCKKPYPRDTDNK
ncbi:MAG: helix-turn-helix transcriptional regulator [Clostridiales bacterium]|nr:helix-turn-helix transcriptional regulator [Clostridiales bacterium]